MTLIEQNIKKINLIVTQFEELRENDLGNLTKTITKALQTIIDELASDFQLVDKNSMRQIKYYTFVNRIKEAKSLKEKFVRSNMLQKFENIDCNLLEEEDGDSISETRKKLFELDDLIGVKILTDLLCDAKNIMEIIKSSEFKKRARGKGILLDADDISVQPVIMKNGLPIYKIKGKYEDKYLFELQIKSKLISAWGDMEHSIFYKDYSISPVRNTAKKSMVHVGKLLFNIDDFLQDIRNADKDYSRDAQALLFIDWAKNGYGECLTDILDGVDFNFSSISDILFAIKIDNSVEDDISERNLRNNHFEIKSENSLIQNYISKRNDSFELQILESIVLSWNLDEAIEITSETIEQVVTEYLEIVKKAFSSVLKSDLSGMESEDINLLLDKLHKSSLNYNSDKSFLLDIKGCMSFMEYAKGIDDFIEVQDEGVDRITIDNFKTALFLQNNNGEVEKFVAELKDSDKFMFELQKLEESIPKDNDRYAKLKKEVNSLTNKLS